MVFCVICFSLLTAGRQTDLAALSSSCQGAASGNHTDVDWNTKDTFLGVAGHRLARPRERSWESLTGTDGDETMMDKPGDDAGETSAIKSKNPNSEAIGSIDCHTRSMWSLAVSRLVPDLCWWRWAVRRSQTTAGRTKQVACGELGLWVLH